jgi:hypothetical protein
MCCHVLRACCCCGRAQGVLLHEMLTNLSPFGNMSYADIFAHLNDPDLHVELLDESMSATACTFVSELLVVDERQRLGSRTTASTADDGSAASAADGACGEMADGSSRASVPGVVAASNVAVRGHAFFASIDWVRLERKEMPAPFADALQLEGETLTALDEPMLPPPWAGQAHAR